MLYCPGKADVELVFYNNSATSRLATMNFSLVIEKSVYDDEITIDSDEFNALTKLLEEAKKNYDYVIEESKKSAESVLDEINKKIGMAEFSIDDDGNLIYTNNGSYFFVVNDDGNLYWEVV